MRQAKKAHDENSQWFRDYSALCNEKADLLRKLDALDDSHLKELEQEVSKKDQTLKSVNTSLRAFQTFAKELCTLLGSTPLSVSNAIHIIDTSRLTGDPAKAAMSLFLSYEMLPPLTWRAASVVEVSKVNSLTGLVASSMSLTKTSFTAALTP